MLLFFAALFVLVGGLEAAGVLEQIARSLAQLGSLSPIWLGIGAIWIVAVLSAVVDNIPITAVTWSKRGLPVMILACVISSLLYGLFFPWFTH